MMALAVAETPGTALRSPGPARGGQDELDRAVLARAQAGDPMAMRAFVVRYERPVFALLSRMLGAGTHVEDLAQETFLRAYRALAGFDPAGAARLSTWLLTIATRLALDARKRKRVPAVSLDDHAGLAVDATTPETERARRELGRAIARAAAELDDDQRATFILAELHGFTMCEIAEALGGPENTVKTRLHRARHHMRERLAAYAPEESHART